MENERELVRCINCGEALVPVKDGEGEYMWLSVDPWHPYQCPTASEPGGMHIRPPEDLDEPDCPHGLSAWLCEGPQHYPMS